MAQFESEIELRVKVLDKELDELNKKIRAIEKPIDLNTKSGRLRQQKQELLEEKKITAELVKQQKLRQKTRARKGRDALTGLGFSALFGGGPGEILGGGIGALTGGLGGSLLGSVIGRSFDDLQKQSNDLGAALNSTTFDAKKLAEAFGTQGSSIQRLLEETKEVAGASAAAEQAANLLAASIGEDAVQSFKDLDAANRELNDALSQLNTEFAAVAATIAGPLISALAKLLERANQANARQRILDEGGADAQRVRDAFRGVKEEGGSADAANRAAQLEAAKILEERRQAAIQQTKTFNLENSKTLEILRNEEEILTRGSDLLNDQVFALEKQNIELRTAAKLNKENLTELERQVIEQERINELKELQNSRRQASSRAAAQSARETEAAARKEQQVQASLAQLAVQEFQLIGQTLDIGRTRLGQVEAQLNRLNEVKQLQAAAILAGTEDSRIQQAKLIILERQTELEREKLKNIQTQLLVQKEIQALQSQQQVEGLSRALGQQLEQSSFLPSGNQFADQSELLALDQTQRYENAIAGINNQIEIQQTLLQKGTADQRAFAEAALPGLQRQQQLYETLLPQIFAAEQAQLKFNQALELVQGPVNAFVGGLTSGLQGIIDGTKSVEEAFADMLKGIANALIQTAAQMIAQYIAIGIARQFAGIGTGGGKGGIDSFTGKINPSVGSGTGFADGGFVTRPTNAMIGEGGQPEYVIPESKMSSAMQRYNAGARGDAVVDGADNYGGVGFKGSQGVMDGPSEVRIEGGVFQYNDTNYIRQDQIPAIIKQASRQGEARALRRLQMSPAARRKAGV